jgi:hypothetical protein
MERRTRGFIGGVGTGQLVLSDGVGVTPADPLPVRANGSREEDDFMLTSGSHMSAR